MKKESTKQSGEARKSKTQEAKIAAKPPTGGNDKAVGKQIAGSKGTGGKAMAKKGGKK